MPRNSNAGMVTLNTRADAVWMKLSLIQSMRLSSTPRNSMANTGAVMFRVSRKIASMPGEPWVGVVRGLMISHRRRRRLVDRLRGLAREDVLISAKLTSGYLPIEIFGAQVSHSSANL